MRTNHTSQIKRSKTKRGFTLIELLVVIAIIGILATFIVASFNNAQAKSRDARRKSDLDALKKALELYKSDTAGGSYYPNVITVANLVTAGYIRQMPADPRGATFNDYAANYFEGPASCTTACTDYRLTANLENTQDPQIASSQLDCPAAYGATYAATNPYVVCP